MILKDGITLYHGSFTQVKNIDLEQCRQGKDFGRGFYLTSDLNQAKSFAKSTVYKKIRKNELDSNTKFAYVSTFIFHLNKNLKIFEFENADSSWLHCVSAHRMQGIFSDEIKKYKDFDIISGKVANDKTNPTITLYLSGAYGNLESEQADKIAISFLMPQVLTDQICFRTKNAILSLEWISSIEVPYE